MGRQDETCAPREMSGMFGVAFVFLGELYFGDASASDEAHICVTGTCVVLRGIRYVKHRCFSFGDDAFRKLVNKRTLITHAAAVGTNVQGADTNKA